MDMMAGPLQLVLVLAPGSMLVWIKSTEFSTFELCLAAGVWTISRISSSPLMINKRFRYPLSNYAAHITDITIKLVPLCSPFTPPPRQLNSLAITLLFTESLNCACYVILNCLSLVAVRVTCIINRIWPVKPFSRANLVRSMESDPFDRLKDGEIFLALANGILIEYSGSGTESYWF